MKRRAPLAMSLLLVLIALPLAGFADQDGLTKTNTQGPVSVALTLVPPVKAASPIRVRVAFNTHSVALDGIALESAIALRKADGSEERPTVIEQTGGGHHRRTVVVFPGQPPGDSLQIVVKNVGGVEERLFRWDLPLAP